MADHSKEHQKDGKDGDKDDDKDFDKDDDKDDGDKVALAEKEPDKDDIEGPDVTRGRSRSHSGSRSKGGKSALPSRKPSTLLTQLPIV